MEAGQDLIAPPIHVDTSRVHSHHRPFVERDADYGNVAYVECRKCGTPNLLDPRRMEDSKVGVFLLCTQCWQRFLVRRTDLDRPVPDDVVVPLYTPVEPHRRRSRR
jgi:hypothetical protein